MVIDFALTKDSKYNEATEVFHQIKGQRQVYGFKFETKESAELFGRAVHAALENLRSDISGMSLLRDL